MKGPSKNVEKKNPFKNTSPSQSKNKNITQNDKKISIQKFQKKKKKKKMKQMLISQNYIRF